MTSTAKLSPVIAGSDTSEIRRRISDFPEQRHEVFESRVRLTDNKLKDMTIGERDIDVTFDFSCDFQGKLTIELAPIALDETTKPLLDFCHMRSRNVEFCTLMGISKLTGYTVSSDSVYFESDGMKTTPDSAILHPSVKVAHVEVAAVGKRGQRNPDTVTYGVVGLLGLRHTTATSRVGRVTMSAPMKLDRFDTICGHISIERSASDASKGQSTEESEVNCAANWLSQCDEQVRSLLDVLSVAQGRMIRWSIRQAFAGHEFISAVFRGPQRTTNPIEPTFYHLNPGPIVELALQSYTPELRKRTGIDVAIEWFLMNPRYNEAQILALMTALEHLVFVFDKTQGDSGHLAECSFERIKRALRDAADKFLAELDKDDPDYERARNGIYAIKEGMTFANKLDLKQRLARMLKTYGVPLSGIDGDIGDLVSVRNKIVHRGLYQPSGPDDRQLSHLVGVARELLRRTFLALLKFEGEYRTWSNGPESAQFTPQTN